MCQIRQSPPEGAGFASALKAQFENLVLMPHALPPRKGRLRTLDLRPLTVTMTDAESLPLTTMPHDLPISVSGIIIPEREAAMVDLIRAYLTEIGRVMDISRLEAVSASDDYPAALAAVKRGFGTERALMRSDNVDMVGVAMAASIVRDGVVKTHLVFHLGPLVPLFMCPPESEEHRQAVYMLAHECAHIEDLKMKDEAFPGVLLQPREVGWLEQNLGPVGWALWEEYYACRRSAIFDPEQTSTFEDIVLSCMENAQGEVDEAVKRYRWHADLHQVWQETIEPATRVMKAAAYLFGHVDGLNGDWDTIPRLRDRLDDHPLAEVINDMSDELQRLWDARGAWDGYEDFLDLNYIVRDGYEVAGIDVQEGPGGTAHLAIPFRPSNSVV